MSNSKSFSAPSVLGIALAGILVGGLTGCVAYGDRPARGEVYVAPVGGELAMMEDDYVYYPTYEVYYSSRRHNFIYLDGRTWVTRPSPPHVSVNVFLASPSVSMDFHNAPSYHHQTTIKQYPRNWAPPNREHDQQNKPQGDWRKDERPDQRH
jgi:hypothetical protein